MAQTSAIFCSFGNCKRGESNPRVGEDKRDHSRWKKKAEDALIRYVFFYRSTYWFPKPILKRMLIQNSRLMRSMRSRPSNLSTSKKARSQNCCFLKWFIVKVKAPRDMIAPFGPKAWKGLLRWENSLPQLSKALFESVSFGTKRKHEWKVWQLRQSGCDRPRFALANRMISKVCLPYNALWVKLF